MKSEWKKVRIKEIAKIVSGFAFKSQDFVEEGVPVLKIGNIGIGKADFKQGNTQFITKAQSKQVNEKYIIKRNDVLVSLTGSHISQPNSVVGRVGKYQYEFPALLNQRTAKIIVNKGTDLMFFYYYLLSQKMRNTIALQAQGAASQANISPNDILHLFVTIPDLLTQKKIASVLSAYDELIENNNQRIKLLEEMASDIYKEWFVRFRFPNYQNTKFFDKDGNEVSHGTKGAIPEGWEKTQLKNHIEYFRGKSYSSAELRENEGLAMLNLKNVNRQGGFRRDGLKYFEGKYNPNNEARSGDIIMAVTDMTQEREIVGRVARVPDMRIEKFIISMDLIRIEPITLPKIFTYCFFRFSGIGYQLKEFANGANVLHLTPSLIDFQKAIIPDVKICETFEKIVEPMITEIDVLNNKNQILQETRDLLLPRLISGKLSVEELEEVEMNRAAEPQEKYN